MSVITSSAGDQTSSTATIDSLAQQATQLDLFVRQAAAAGESLDAVERPTFDQALRIGQLAIDLFLSLQGTGDLGPSVVTESEETLHRSDEPVRREVRTVFGLHAFDGFVYSPGPHLKIALRPLDARMRLPAGINSYLFEEFSQFFCVEQAFGLSRQGLQTTLRQDVCVDQLQDINHRLGTQADEYLEELPVPAASDEGELLVLTGDGKGVPLVRADAAKLPVRANLPSVPATAVWRSWPVCIRSIVTTARRTTFWPVCSAMQTARPRAVVRSRASRKCGPASLNGWTMAMAHRWKSTVRWPPSRGQPDESSPVFNLVRL
jgi:hypothetical protein